MDTEEQRSDWKNIIIYEIAANYGTSLAASVFGALMDVINLRGIGGLLLILGIQSILYYLDDRQYQTSPSRSVYAWRASINIAISILDLIILASMGIEDHRNSSRFRDTTPKMLILSMFAASFLIGVMRYTVFFIVCIYRLFS